jgi:hypothetical protein
MRAVLSSFITVLIAGFPLMCLAQRDIPHKVSGGCPVSPTHQIKWRPPLGGRLSNVHGAGRGTYRDNSIFYFELQCCLRRIYRCQCTGNCGRVASSVVRLEDGQWPA